MPFLSNERTKNSNNFGFIKLDNLEELMKELLENFKILQNYVRNAKVFIKILNYKLKYNYLIS